MKGQWKTLQHFLSLLSSLCNSHDFHIFLAIVFYSCWCYNRHYILVAVLSPNKRLSYGNMQLVLTLDFFDCSSLTFLWMEHRSIWILTLVISLFLYLFLSLSLQLFLDNSQNNKAGYSATKVACGWTGAVMKKTNPSIWTGAVMQKPHKTPKKLTVTDQPMGIAGM